LLVAVGLPLWEPLLLASVLTAALRPVHTRLAAKLRGRPGIALWILILGVWWCWC